MGAKGSWSHPTSTFASLGLGLVSQAPHTLYLPPLVWRQRAFFSPEFVGSTHLEVRGSRPSLVTGGTLRLSEDGSVVFLLKVSHRIDPPTSLCSVFLPLDLILSSRAHPRQLDA